MDFLEFIDAFNMKKCYDIIIKNVAHLRTYYNPNF